MERELKLDAEAAQADGLPPAEQKNYKFINAAIKSLTPLLLHSLLKQNECVEDDEWNVAAAAALCLTTATQAVLRFTLIITVTLSLNFQGW